jgi:hypothetical protein
MDNLVDYASAPFNGPFAMRASLLDTVGAAPYEGIWVPIGFAKAGSFEVTDGGTVTGLAAQIWVTNQSAPTNTYILTLGGSITTGDVINLNVTSGVAPAFVVPYTVVSGDTTNTILAGNIAAAVNASAAARSVGLTAVGGAGIITLNWPSVAPGTPSPAEFDQPSSPGPQNTLAVAYLKGGNTETITVTLGSDGQEVATLTAPGLSTPPTVPFPVGWVKARLATLTGTSPTVSMRFQGVA